MNVMITRKHTKGGTLSSLLHRGVRTHLLYFTVFLTGAAVLIIEILGTRILGPFYGSTIFVWSSLISVTLGFLALGYWLGGTLVDRVIRKRILLRGLSVKSAHELLGIIIFLAGVFTILIPKVDTIVLIVTDLFGLRFGPLAAAFVLFSIPLFLLGMITPVAIKYRTEDIAEVGASSGSIFAFSTVGSLAAAVLTGFFLVPYFSLSGIFTVTGVILVALSLAWFSHTRRPSPLYLFLLVVFVFLLVAAPSHAVGPPTEADVIHKERSFFGDIKVYELKSQNRHIRCMMIDTASQSCWNYGTGLSAWAYTRYFRGATNTFPEGETLDILVIGLGGGVVVKELAETDHRVDTVEIDPNVLRVAEEYFDSPDTPNFRYFADDGRYFLNHSDRTYDLIMIDIIIGSDQASHLSTREFFEEAKARLNPGGILSMNTRGWVKTQILQPMVYNTLKTVFPHVKFSVRDAEQSSSVVFFASDRDLSEEMFKGTVPNLYGADFWDSLFDLGEVGILTDDYNPSHVLHLPVAIYGRAITKADFGVELYLYEPPR